MTMGSIPVPGRIVPARAPRRSTRRRARSDVIAGVIVLDRLAEAC